MGRNVRHWMILGSPQIVESFERRIAAAQSTDGDAALSKRISEVQERVGHLTEALAKRPSSEALLAQLDKEERELRELRDRRVASRPKRHGVKNARPRQGGGDHAPVAG